MQGVAGFTPKGLLFPKIISQKFPKKIAYFPPKNSHFPAISQPFFQNFRASRQKQAIFFTKNGPKISSTTLPIECGLFPTKITTKFVLILYSKKFLSFAGEKMGKYDDFWDILVEKS